jgi:superfamily II DNA/RNA helicase
MGSLTLRPKNQITQEFASPTSKIRLLVSTVAIGLGVNIPGVRNVIHWGPSSDILSYWQEIGNFLHWHRDESFVYKYPQSNVKLKRYLFAL